MFYLPKTDNMACGAGSAWLSGDSASRLSRADHHVHHSGGEILGRNGRTDRSSLKFDLGESSQSRRLSKSRIRSRRIVRQLRSWFGEYGSETGYGKFGRTLVPDPPLKNYRPASDQRRRSPNQFPPLRKERVSAAEPEFRSR